MLDDVLAYLGCPHCGEELAREEGSVRCPNRHSFDVARQGYVNLSPPQRAARGDDADMVAARAAFLAAGHFEPLADTVATTCAAVAGDDGCVVDLGAGTGYYLARVLDRLDHRVGVALDASQPALRRAARAHPRIGAVGCDVWHAVPVRADMAAVVLCVFAPRNGPEIARVLRADGGCVVVTPTPRHLAEVAAPLGLLALEDRKQERLADQLSPHLAATDHRQLDLSLRLCRDDLLNLVAMGPTARHVPRSRLRQRVRALPEPVPVTASFTVTVSRPVPGSVTA